MSHEYSIVVPTYNRPHFLKRLLLYYQEQKFPYAIVVADSSFAPSCEENRNVVASLCNTLNVHYQMYRTDISVPLKIAQALDTVNSKYAVICADDDFILPQAIELCVCFLEANPDYSIAHGHALRFFSYTSANRDAHHSLRIETYPQCILDFNDPRLRLQKHLKGYTATFYSVHRRSDLIHNMQVCHDKTADIRFGELLPSCLSLIQGKAKRLDILYMVRQVIPDSSAGKGKRLSWLDLLISDDFSQRYTQFRNCLVEELENVMDLPVTEAKNEVNHAFLAFLALMLYASNIGPCTWEGQDVWKRAVRRIWRVIQILPAAARSAIIERRLVVMGRSPREAYNKLRLKRELTGSPFYADLQPIYEHMMRYPNGVHTFTKE
ncbi:MAG: TIGR00180 family glycosyltransferase [Desulfobacterales bacterium]|nr:TIGR00180 family glycosyltransferase [Desulfobacterales bacterium]